MDLRSSRLISGITAIAGLTVVLTSGCVNTEPFLAGKEAPPTGPVCQAAGAWNNEIAYAADPTHFGQMNPGLAGRIYLFGPIADFPRIGEGSLVVDLYDETHVPSSQQKVPLEEWYFDKDTLKRLVRRDYIGWGYTVFLPWGTFKPEISQIRLKVRFEPVNGNAAIYDESSVTIHKTGVSHRNTQVTLGQQAGSAPAPEQNRVATGTESPRQ
jgi:hypothetical protein